MFREAFSREGAATATVPLGSHHASATRRQHARSLVWRLAEVPRAALPISGVLRKLRAWHRA